VPPPACQVGPVAGAGFGDDVGAAATGTLTAGSSTGLGAGSASGLAPCGLAAVPTTVASGEASNLTWSTANPTTCTASRGWTGTKNTSGTQSTGNLTATTTYTLTCTGAGGSSTAGRPHR